LHFIINFNIEVKFITYIGRNPCCNYCDDEYGMFINFLHSISSFLAELFLLHGVTLAVHYIIDAIDDKKFHNLHIKGLKNLQTSSFIITLRTRSVELVLLLNNLPAKVSHYR